MILFVQYTEMNGMHEVTGPEPTWLPKDSEDQCLTCLWHTSMPQHTSWGVLNKHILRNWKVYPHIERA